MNDPLPILSGSGLLGSGFNVFGRYDADSRTRSLFPTTSRDRTEEVGGRRYSVSFLVRIVDGADTQGEAYSFESREEVQRHFEGKAGVKASVGGTEVVEIGRPASVQPSIYNDGPTVAPIEELAILVPAQQRSRSAGPAAFQFELLSIAGKGHQP